jgi:L-aspartate oxidase
MKFESDFLVIGSGIAGLSFAIEAAELGTVHVITKKNIFESNTSYAQGGIASVIKSNDSFEKHVSDTLIAGADLCNKKAVEMMVSDGPKVIEKLINWGVEFTRNEEGKLSLAKEGGHSHHRILHADDITGKEIERALIEKAFNHPNIKIFKNHIGIDFITEHNIDHNPEPDKIHCFGAYVLDSEKNEIHRFVSAHTILSSGGAGQVYLHTTNPGVATADGIAMAYRAGCEVENLEFVQFHPTSLYLSHRDEEKQSFLISEAVRGFGGILRNHKGEAFMKKYDERLELAPRDIVARAIDSEMKKNHENHVLLDLTHKSPLEIIKHFPNIYQTCLENKIDITKEAIPVVPSAHYLCGGVKTDLEGKTSIHGLFACGEVASTGIHGANRLASNSLLEAMVFANKILKNIKLNKKDIPQVEIPEWDDSGTFDHEEWGMIFHDKQFIRQTMWNYVGIVRSTFRLNRARRRINLILSEIEEFYKKSPVTVELIELRNIAMVAALIIRNAIARKESRGLHFTTDFPDKNEAEKIQKPLRSSRFSKGKK